MLLAYYTILGIRSQRSCNERVRNNGKLINIKREDHHVSMRQITCILQSSLTQPTAQWLQNQGPWKVDEMMSICRNIATFI